MACLRIPTSTVAGHGCKGLRSTQSEEKNGDALEAVDVKGNMAPVWQRRPQGLWQQIH